MPNPFKYGGIVTGEDFADRKKELQYLIGELTSGQNILLYSPRRYGKSSLVTVTLHALQERGIMTAFIDLYGCISEADLVNKLIDKTVVPAYDTVDKMINFLKSAFSGLKPEVTVSTDGNIKVSFAKEVSTLKEKELSQVLDAPEKLAKAKGKRLVVVFDEFQEMANLDGSRLESLMRASFQHHKLTTYVFMGSKRHIIEEMFGNSNRPFYKFAIPFPLGNIATEEFKNFILAKFRETGITVETSLVDSVLALTQGHPYFTQELCHEIWNIACEKNVIQKSVIDQAIANILRIHNDLFIRMWDSMTIPQRKVLFALSLENTISSIYSVTLIQKYNLRSASHVRRAMNQLIKNGIVEKANSDYYVADIFFKEWIKITTMEEG
jgi:hypothetical protein